MPAAGQLAVRCVEKGEPNWEQVVKMDVPSLEPEVPMGQPWMSWLSRVSRPSPPAQLAAAPTESRPMERPMEPQRADIRQRPAHDPRVAGPRHQAVPQCSPMHRGVLAFQQPVAGSGALCHHHGCHVFQRTCCRQPSGGPDCGCGDAPL
mmetsp:Transcript_75880/g.217183  ORF Transcript_75880/g.217183 Transcript_75880/m.217183 type:complete len:149 (+) Transcript_75880:1137-1583(+)